MEWTTVLNIGFLLFFLFCCWAMVRTEPDERHDNENRRNDDRSRGEDN